MNVNLCGHFATVDTPAARMLAMAGERFDAAEAATRAIDPDLASEHWKEARRLVHDATESAGYVGRAIDPSLVETARSFAVAGNSGADTREGLVEAGIQAGLSENVARRSVIEGLVRGANRRGAVVAAPPPVVPSPPVPPPTPRRSRWGFLATDPRAA